MYGNNVIVSQHNPPKVYNYTLSGVLVGSVFTDGSYIDLVVGPDKRLYATDGIRELIGIFSMVDRSLFYQITGTPQPRGIGLATFTLDHMLIHKTSLGCTLLVVYWFVATFLLLL